MKQWHRTSEVRWEKHADVAARTELTCSGQNCRCCCCCCCSWAANVCQQQLNTFNNYNINFHDWKQQHQWRQQWQLEREFTPHKAWENLSEKNESNLTVFKPRLMTALWSGPQYKTVMTCYLLLPPLKLQPFGRIEMCTLNYYYAASEQ